MIEDQGLDHQKPHKGLEGMVPHSPSTEGRDWGPQGQAGRQVSQVLGLTEKSYL